LQPNKAIKEGYHSLRITTFQGRIHTGIKVRQTKTELILRDAEDREVGIPLKDVDEQTNGGSLMPEGLADTLTRDELIDLVRFLSELGKVGPYALSKARLVRTWQVLEPTRAAYRLLTSTSFAAAASGDPTLTWDPAYSTVAGALPLTELPRFKLNDRQIGFVRCRLDASTGGSVQLLLNAAGGVTLWLDNEPVEVHKEMVLDVATGVHTLTFAVDLGQRRESLRCELRDRKGSRARVRVVVGK
jgi:hypothetical protein